MNDQARRLRESAAEAKEKYNNADAKLENYIKRCQHNFSETVYEPIYTPRYTSPGDPPGTMGIDWRGPVFVPSKTEDRWKKECSLCGLVRYTQCFNKVEKKEPRW